jgi:hypothetical protein
MKVSIGKYIHFWGPYQIMDLLFFWHEKYASKELTKRWDYVLHDKLSTWLASTWFANLCQWIHDKRDRKVKIHIDNYDVWNMNHTLALIIVPMLKKLKEEKQGCPWSYHEDGPWYYKFNDYMSEHNWSEEGSYSHGRWEWIMSEMIWAFEEVIKDDESQYWLENGEIDWEAGEYDENNCKPLVWKKKSVVLWDSLNAHHKAIDNGLRLFGRYYRNLWD